MVCMATEHNFFVNPKCSCVLYPIHSIYIYIYSNSITSSSIKSIEYIIRILWYMVCLATRYSTGITGTEQVYVDGRMQTCGAMGIPRRL